MFIHIHLQGASTDVLALHPHTQARANQTEEMTQGKAFFFFPPYLAFIHFSSLAGSPYSLRNSQRCRNTHFWQDQFKLLAEIY